MEQKSSMKISVRQALLLFVFMVGSPSIRSVPQYAIEEAKHAAWVSPLISFLATILLLFIVQKIFEKYDKESLTAIMEDILGKAAGKTLGIIYFLYITLAVAFYIRFYSERLSASLSINTSHIVYSGILLIVIAYILKYDLLVMARINEILLFLVAVSFILMNLMVLPKLKLSYFYPVTYTDIIPIIKGNVGITALWAYITFIFLFSDRISNKRNTFRIGVKATSFLLILTILVIIVPLGVFGSSAKDLYYPYASAIQNIELFNTIERLGALIIAIWIMTDYSLISTLIFTGLHTLKNVLGFTDHKPYINIYIVALFFLSVYITDRSYELQVIASHILIYVNILLGFVIPFIMYFTGKIRKKL